MGPSLGAEDLTELNLANNLRALGNRLIPGASRKECNLADTLIAAWGDEAERTVELNCTWPSDSKNCEIISRGVLRY